MTATPSASAPTAVRVWDLPTRSFHWLLAACVVASIVSAKIGGNALAWHFRFGYAILALLAFRLLWGFAGGRWSRFASFLPTPAKLGRYLRGRAQPGEWLEVGHNPLGALSVFAVLGVLAAQAATGLFADDEIASTGPLVRFVTGSTSLALTHWHKGAGQWLIFGLVGLHLVAIAFYVGVRRQSLLRPMWNGDKLLPPLAPASADGPRQRVLAAVLLAACAAAVTAVVRLGG